MWVLRFGRVLSERKDMKIKLGSATVTSEWVPPAELPDLTKAKTIAIDVETRDPNLKKMGPGWARGDGEVVGYAVATADWAGYVPIRHAGGGNIDEKQVNKWLKKVFDCPADKIMHNAQYDLGWIKRMGFNMKGRVIDTMVAASLLDENRRSYSLNALCYELLGVAKSEKLLHAAAADFGIDAKAEMWKMPAMFVGPYAQNDAEITLDLWNYLSTQLKQEELTTVANLELDLLPCLVDMTWRGIRVNMDKAEITRNAILKREIEVLKEIKRVSGCNIEIWAAASIAKAFDKLSIAYPKTEKGAPSFRKQFLSEHPDKLPKLIVEARNLNKTSGTFINSILNFCNADGRIHSHINQIRSDDGGTVSGRFSMNNPNLQQIPARDPEIGPLIRSLFLPEEGEQWAAIDYSQQEPRILVHYAKAHLNQGGSRGYVKSLMGRKCRFNTWEPDAYGMHKALPFEEARLEHGPYTKLIRAYTYKALNRLIQASAADMTKKAMLDLYQAGYLPMLQIHDELARHDDIPLFLLLNSPAWSGFALQRRGFFIAPVGELLYNPRKSHKGACHGYYPLEKCTGPHRSLHRIEKPVQTRRPNNQWTAALNV